MAKILKRTKHKNCKLKLYFLLKERKKINNKDGTITNKELCLINNEQAHANEANISWLHFPPIDLSLHIPR